MPQVKNASDHALRSAANRVLQTDWLRLRYALVMALLFLCSRLPLLPLGFGLDPDSWRIAGSSFDIRHHLVYHASRFPGYPVPEFVNALVIDLGWFASNALTAILSLASVFAYGYILRESEENDKGLDVSDQDFTKTYVFSAYKQENWSAGLLLAKYTHKNYLSSKNLAYAATAAGYASVDAPYAVPVGPGRHLVLL